VHVAECAVLSLRSPMRFSSRDHAASVVSSQSNITWWARARAPAWVCSPAPSCSVKVTRVVGAAMRAFSTRSG
jgi:hypothetical protein